MITDVILSFSLNLFFDRQCKNILNSCTADPLWLVKVVSKWNSRLNQINMIIWLIPRGMNLKEKTIKAARQKIILRIQFLTGDRGEIYYMDPDWLLFKFRKLGMAGQCHLFYIGKFCVCSDIISTTEWCS